MHFVPPYIRDALVAPAWLAATLLLIACAARIARRLFDARDMAKLAQTVVIIAWAYVLAAAMALSAVRALTGLGLVIAVGAAAAATLLLLKQQGVSSPSAPNEASTHRTSYAWWAVICLLLANVLVNGLMAYPNEYDSLAYHIPLIDQWLQAGRLCAPDGPEWTYPGNGEMLGLWMVAPFSGDFLIALTNVPALVLLAASAIRLGALLGLPFAAACGTTALLLVGVVPWTQAVDARNDVAAGALFLAGLCYLADHLERGNIADLAFVALCAGLLGGVKYYALGYAAALGLIAVGATTLKFGIGKGLRAVAIGAAGGVFGCGYWYLRNWWSAGSPFYPLGFSSGGGDIGNYYPGIWKSTIAGSADGELASLIVQAIWNWLGPAHLIASFALPLTIAWLAFGARADGDGRRQPIRPVLAAALLASLALLAITPVLVEDVPGSRNQIRYGHILARYGFTTFSLSLLGFVALASVMTRALARHIIPETRAASIARWGWPAVFIGLIALEASGLLGRSGRVARRSDPLVLFVAFDAWALGLILVGILSRRTTARRLVAASAWPAMAIAVAALSWSWHAGFQRHYDRDTTNGVLGLLADASPKLETLCVLTPKCYPFFGPSRERVVLRPIWAASYPDFLRILERHGADAVVFDKSGGTDGRFAKVVAKAEEDDSRFRRLVDRRGYIVLRCEAGTTTVAMSDESGSASGEGTCQPAMH